MYKFTIKDNIERTLNTFYQGKELLILDKFKGFDICESEYSDEDYYIYFSDVLRNLSVARRFFTIKKNELDIVTSFYNKYAENGVRKYLKMLELKNISDENIDTIYEENKFFFIACNITNSEWKEFCS